MLRHSQGHLLPIGWFVWVTEHHKGAELPNPINQPDQVHAHDPFSIHAFVWNCELRILDLGHAVDCYEISEIGTYLLLFQISLFGIETFGTTKVTASIPICRVCSPILYLLDMHMSCVYLWSYIEKNTLFS